MLTEGLIGYVEVSGQDWVHMVSFLFGFTLRGNNGS